MKKISDMYRLYRELPIFQALIAALEKLSDTSSETPPLLSLSLAITVIHTYDRVVAETVRRSPVIYSFTGKLILYRIIQDHAWLLFNDVILNIEQESKNKKRKKPRRRAGTLKSDVVLLRCYNPYADLKYEAVIEEQVCPYTVEVTKRVKVKRKKISVNKKVTTVGSYDPTLHATSLTSSTDYTTADWRKPMPYNEKLRRAKTDGEKRDLGQTQVGLVDVLKGRYRKRAVEYPHRCVDCPPERSPLDLFTISGCSLVSSDRNYTVAMKSQDRTLADWAATCGGSLAMAAHNVHVMAEAKKATRENYRTRRNDRIHHLTFHSANNFAVVKDESWKTRNTEAYSSSSSESSSYNSDEERRPSEYQDNGWNSFGSYKIPKHPKSSKPCPKSRRRNPSLIEKTVNEELDLKTSVVTEFPDEVPDAVPFIQSDVIDPVNNNEIGDEDDLNLDFLEDIDIGKF